MRFLAVELDRLACAQHELAVTGVQVQGRPQWSGVGTRLGRCLLRVLDLAGALLGWFLPMRNLLASYCQDITVLDLPLYLIPLGFQEPFQGEIEIRLLHAYFPYAEIGRWAGPL